MIDTGCRSCLAGVIVIHRLGLYRSNLIPATMKMHATNDKSINILGAAVLCFTGRNDMGEEISTKQVTCIADSSEKILSAKKLAPTLT